MVEVYQTTAPDEDAHIEGKLLSSKTNTESTSPKDLEAQILPPGKQVRLMTYNFFLRPFLVTSGGTDYKEERLKEFVDTYLDRFDVICFQEVFDLYNSRKYRLIDMAKKKGFPFHAAGYPPMFFGGYCCDGGLLTISRYPITKSHFHVYETPGADHDMMSMKGVLYVRVDLSSLGGSALHLFSTHTQASYLDSPLENYAASYVARFEQLKEMKNLAKKMVFDAPESVYDRHNDIAILLGDFNMNGQTMNQAQFAKFLEVKDVPRYKPILPLFIDEYRALLKAFENQPDSPEGWTLRDMARESYTQGTVAPVTFADVEKAADDAEQPYLPCDPNLHNVDDNMTLQALDYMFYLQPNNVVKRGSLMKAQGDLKMRINIDSTVIEKLPIEGYLWKHCSDHFGISTIID